VKHLECEFEAEVLAVALQSPWPEGAAEPLRQHVNQCAICSDIVTIAGAIDQNWQELRSDAVLPDPGTMWWRAQLRARREAAVAAGRPITGVQVLAAACALAVLAAYYRNAAVWFFALARKGIAALTVPLADHLLLAVAAVVLVLLLPAAVLLTVTRD
jgi:hypothetical protein